MSSVIHRLHELRRWLTLYSMSRVDTQSEEIEIKEKDSVAIDH